MKLNPISDISRSHINNIRLSHSSLKNLPSFPKPIVLDCWKTFPYLWACQSHRLDSGCETCGFPAPVTAAWEVIAAAALSAPSERQNQPLPAATVASAWEWATLWVPPFQPLLPRRQWCLWRYSWSAEGRCLRAAGNSSVSSLVLFLVLHPSSCAASSSAWAAAPLWGPFCASQTPAVSLLLESSNTVMFVSTLRGIYMPDADKRDC